MMVLVKDILAYAYNRLWSRKHPQLQRPQNSGQDMMIESREMMV